MTIGTKLGVGFGVVIALMAISAGTAYYNISLTQEELVSVLDEAVPTVRSCDRLLAELNQASADLRGYLAIGSNAELKKSFKADSVQAWEEVQRELARLTNLTASHAAEVERQQTETLARMIDEQHSYHRNIFEVVDSDDNVPAWNLFRREFSPRVEQILRGLDSIIDSEVTQNVPGHGKLLQALADVRESYVRVAGDLAAYLNSDIEDSKRAFDASSRDNETAFQALLPLVDKFTPAQQQHWSRVVSLREELAPIPVRLVQMRGADDWNRAEFIWLTQSAPVGRKLRVVLDQIAETAEGRRIKEREALDSASRTTVAALSVATAVSIVIGSAVAVLFSRSMVTTVRSLADRAKQISEGDLRGETVAKQGADELSQLADGFNVMLTNLRDLTGQILSVTENVNSAASQISSSAKQQASSTKEQAATVQEVTSTMQEISQSGAQIVAKAKEVAAVAEQASSASKSGTDAVQNTNRTMEAIREQVEEVAENIVALSEKTQAVGEIITTVNEIAEQSNLLALNATIEAAEAGEEGNRFSVVAGEMKNLADQAKECTVHVRKILGEIQKAINTSVMLTEEAVKRVESGKQQADVSENVIRQISSTTEESIQAFQQIIGATNQQQIGLEQVAQGMKDIDLAAQQTATGTGQLEQAVVNLSAMSTQLRTAVASYKV